MKKMMMRALALLLVCTAILPLVACKKEDEEEEQKKEPTNQEPAIDYSTDGVFDYHDYDPKKTYQPEELSNLPVDDYITLGRYEGLTLTLQEENITITDALLENRIQAILAENHPDARITDRPVAWKDTVVVDYVGTIDGVAFQGGSAENQTIAVTEANANSYIPGFVEGLVGITPGVVTPIDVTFPENYHNAEFAGKAAVFTFTVHYIVGDPKLTDEFVSDYTKGEFTTAEAYKENLRKEMNDEAYEVAVRQAFWGKIAENAALKKAPEETVLYYYGYYYQMYSYYASMYGMTIDTYLTYMGMTLSDMFDACCDMIKSQLVYYAVFKAKNYQFTEEQYKEALELYTDSNLAALNEERKAENKVEMTREEAMEYFDKNNKTMIELQVLEEIAYDDLIKDYKIEIKKTENKDDTTNKDEEK